MGWLCLIRLCSSNGFVVGGCSSCCFVVGVGVVVVVCRM